MKVGYIGLGVMGGPMALNLLKAGHEVTVNDIDSAKAEKQLAAGAAWADTPRAVAEASEIVLTSVPGPPQVKAIADGDRGLVAGLSEGMLWADMTTNSPDYVQELSRQVEAKGARMLDAPVTGAVDGARNGTMTIFVGGAAGDLARIQPLFDVLGRMTVHGGPVGAGNVVKLITNQLWFIHARAIGEAMTWGVKWGLDPLVLVDAIRNSVGDSFVAHHDMPSIFAGHYDPSFTLDLCLKDLGLTVEQIRKLGVPAELTDTTEALFRKARETYGGGAAELHVVKLVEDAAGIELRAAGDWVPHWEK